MLSYLSDDNFRSGWNILLYLSLLLPTVHFWSGWIWYFTNFTWCKETSHLRFVLIQAGDMFVTLVAFTILAKNTIRFKLFRIKVSGNQVTECFILLCTWFTITSMLSGITGGIIFYFENSVSYDRYQWIAPPRYLTPKDEATFEEILATEVYMSKCGQYPNVTETLLKLIEKYQSNSQFLSKEYPGTFKQYRNTLGKLHLAHGLYLYYHGKYKEAIVSFNSSITPNQFELHNKYYLICARNILGEYSQEDLNLQKKEFLQEMRLALVEDNEVPRNETYKNCEMRWLPFLMIDYLDMLEPISNEQISQKDEQTREISSSGLFMDIWPTHLEFAELSSVTYCKSRLSQLSSWLFIAEFDDNTDNTGYYGIAVRHNRTNEVVIAHRGTTFDINTASLLADYQLFLRKTPEQFRIARQFTNEIRNRNELGRSGIVWHTGHSLGGAIAEFLVANETLSKQQTLSFAVTFDSPGILEIIEEYHYRSETPENLPKPNEFFVIGYLSVPNVVNTMGTHIGLTLRLSPLPRLVSFPVLAELGYDIFISKMISNHLKPVIDLLASEANKQLHWHSIQTIINSFKIPPNKNGLPRIMKPVLQWPKGFQQFNCFLNLASEHNLTTLDITKYGNNSEVLNDFKRCNYHVIDNYGYSHFPLPLQIWNKKIQNFFKKIIDIHNDPKRKYVSVRLNPNCELIKFVNGNATQLILNALHAKTNDLYPNMKMITLDTSLILINNEQIHSTDIINISILFSLVNLDNCIL
ncbi:unnamed protein product [Adineta ricciae]|uniref:Fungal lipase-like domain-containing protein n=1 Tax=Adineta ricciae TaxID=249248 RepID=A0A815ALR1_ADIRI|nr:unnamed protein product [Adineta ricciae]CAF1627583.1 unnamed protein product [Adineta ricciae]